MFRFPTPELVEARGDENMTEPELIIKDWNNGLTATEIGEKIGKTRSAVLGKISRLRASGFYLERRAMIGEDGETRYKEKAKRVLKARKQSAQLSFDDYFTPPSSSTPDIPATNSIELPPVMVSQGVDLFSLKASQCHFVIGRHDDTSMYCGEPVHRRSMCSEHHARCYYRPKKD
jgi:hypothetical protein